MSTIVDEKEIKEESIEVKAEPVNPIEFMGEVRTEFTKITWPSREQVTREFFSVLILVAFLTSIIFILDKAFEFVVNFFTGRFF